ncbi:MAG: alpha/beta hydrolase [Thermoleophilaceae bacterium]|nr:alpha/beta hydrolase [Thermoleophilaceae bacterium]
MATTDSKTYWRSPELGAGQTVTLLQGELRYFESGSGETLVFVHGLLVNANLWRKVVPTLSKDHHCIVLDLPFGSHEIPMPNAELDPHGMADLIADAIEALDLDNVTLVGNDSGGALSQMVATRRSERIARLVLTSCDAFDNFPPAMFKPLLMTARIPGGLLALATSLRPGPPRQLPLAFGWLTKRPLDRDASDSYVLPVATSSAVRADVRRFLLTANPSYTIEAAGHLGEFEKPALIAFSREDRFFPNEHAERLATILPDARLEWVEDARTFSMEDNPARVAELVAGFVRETAQDSVSARAV